MRFVKFGWQYSKGEFQPLGVAGFSAIGFFMKHVMLSIATYEGSGRWL